MSIIQAVIFGIVEGITEFLPVSSTGHLILTARILNITQTEFLKSFAIAIQLGAIMAVVMLYGRKIIQSWEISKRLLVAFLPTAVVGLILYKLIKKYLLGNNAVVLWALFIGGALLIIFELWHQEKIDARDSLESISYKQSFCIGLFQSIAVIPGVSRAAATIVGGLLLGLKRRTIVEFSFLLAIPTMCAATALDLLKSAPAFSRDQFLVLAVGFVVSFLVAILAIRFLLAFIKKHTFIPFGIYRILVAIAFWLKIG